MNLEQQVEEIAKDVSQIKYLLNGNGDRGLVAKVVDHEKWFIEQSKKNSDLITYIFRAFIGIGITYIAYKVGLKH